MSTIIRTYAKCDVLHLGIHFHRLHFFFCVEGWPKTTCHAPPFLWQCVRQRERSPRSPRTCLLVVRTGTVGYHQSLRRSNFGRSSEPRQKPRVCAGCRGQRLFLAHCPHFARMKEIGGALPKNKTG